MAITKLILRYKFRNIEGAFMKGIILSGGSGRDYEKSL